MTRNSPPEKTKSLHLSSFPDADKYSDQNNLHEKGRTLAHSSGTVPYIKEV